MIAEPDQDVFRQLDLLDKLNLHAAVGLVDHDAIVKILAGLRRQLRIAAHRAPPVTAPVSVSIE